MGKAFFSACFLVFWGGAFFRDSGYIKGGFRKPSLTTQELEQLKAEEASLQGKVAEIKEELEFTTDDLEKHKIHLTLLEEYAFSEKERGEEKTEKLSQTQEKLVNLTERNLALERKVIIFTEELERLKNTIKQTALLGLWLKLHNKIHFVLAKGAETLARLSINSTYHQILRRTKQTYDFSDNLTATIRDFESGFNFELDPLESYTEKSLDSVKGDLEEIYCDLIFAFAVRTIENAPKDYRNHYLLLVSDSRIGFECNSEFCRLSREQLNYESA
ncbi:hypothetical protein GlitD10_2531 [Gloeomargarita lithophora Alchichica-D10]|uniref:Uncharacterized protein n=1 Tax=Gloeomargarita lithophora Alchichica-D10 TaxID=1188229 RepID=A0A1J0AG23_9CYAN|nr:hypothetical protein [Gloeomargarita lithophora]APB34869.1 hypothetical protein GlitD10_2531 [Gloeomargarita lithophora Alchichica-D10]